MGFDVPAVENAIVSHAMESGHCDRVNLHEPKNAPGNGVTAATWVREMKSIRSSGLASTSIRVIWNIRIYLPMFQEPQDLIDRNVLTATAALMKAYTGDFELGGQARHIDVLGAHGEPLQADAGYLTQDEREYRAMVITLPVIFNDVWSQSP